MGRVPEGRLLPASDFAFLVTRAGSDAMPTPAHVELTRTLMAATSPKAIAESLRSLVDHDVRDELGAVDVPALVVVGTHDVLTPPRMAKEIVRHLPHAELVVLDGMGHMPMLEARAELNRLITEFAAKLAVIDRCAGCARRALDRRGVRPPGARSCSFPRARWRRARCAAGRRRRASGRCSSRTAWSPALDAVVLAGGSAFGLAACDGVMRFCEERGMGFPTPAGVVPIVVGAGALRPARAATRRCGPARPRAAPRARPRPTARSRSGPVGAATGATVGGVARPGARAARLDGIAPRTGRATWSSPRWWR